MKYHRSIVSAFALTATSIGAYALEESGIPLVYEVENTGAAYAAPEFPDFDYLPIVRPLPDAFRFFDGSRDTSFESWEARRNQIKASIEKYEIGIKPDASDLTVTASYTPPVAGGTVGSLTVLVTRDSNGKTLTLTSKVYIPTGWEDYGPMPALIPMTNRARATGPNYGSLPSAVFSARPIATIDFVHNQVTSYGGNGTNIINNPFYQMYPEFVSAGRSDSNSGQYAAWAWGVSRLIDGIQLAAQQAVDPLPIDTARLAVTGCSYAGKMALFSGAFDERIALTIPQESGGGGAPAWRVSQQIEGDRVVESLSHTNRSWFASQMFQFSYNNVYKLPHDHHELMAMVAPRAMLQTGNTDFNWLSNRANYVSARATQRVYETLGVGDRFGFYIDGNHGHCATRPEQSPAIAAFVDKFLLGFEDVNSSVHVHPYPNLDYQRWTAWWGTGEPEFPNDWNPGNGTVVASMDASFAVESAATVEAGYAVSIPGPHAAANVALVGAGAQLDIVADDGRSYTLTVPLPNAEYEIPAIDNTWYPSGDAQSPLVYQGSAAAGFGGVATHIVFSAVGQNNGGAGNPAGPGLISDTEDPVRVKFHARSGDEGGAWSDMSTVFYGTQPAMGDVNGDGAIDTSDLQAMQQLMRKREGDTGWIPQADLDGDGVITLYDYRRLLVKVPRASS